MSYKIEYRMTHRGYSFFSYRQQNKTMLKWLYKARFIHIIFYVFKYFTINTSESRTKHNPDDVRKMWMWRCQSFSLQLLSLLSSHLFSHWLSHNLHFYPIQMQKRKGVRNISLCFTVIGRVEATEQADGGNPAVHVLLRLSYQIPDSFLRLQVEDEAAL